MERSSNGDMALEKIFINQVLKFETNGKFACCLQRNISFDNIQTSICNILQC